MTTLISKDLATKKINVTREFAAPVEKTWKAWTDRNSLDQWWAPKPWRVETKYMDFKEGGYWLYAMVGPNSGEKHWAKLDYIKILNLKHIIVINSFCDENGKTSPDAPGMDWKIVFSASTAGTKVEVDITFASEKDLKAMLDRGFQEGFTSALSNLDELLK